LRDPILPDAQSLPRAPKAVACHACIDIIASQKGDATPFSRSAFTLPVIWKNWGNFAGGGSAAQRNTPPCQVAAGLERFSGATAKSSR
jgi:hypothetical protein